MNALVRHYEQRDRESVRYICCETGLMGEPMEVFFEGREVFADMWSRYYTDYEPEHCWVAQVDGRVVGYMLGTVDTHTQERVFTEKVIPGVTRKIFTTKCAWSVKTLRYLKNSILSWRRGELKMPNLADEYPAHLHTNLIDGYRGIGLGNQMLQVWLEHLASHGTSAVHLVTTTYNTQAVPFYKRFGFEPIFELPITMYEDVIAEPIAMLGMGLKLVHSDCGEENAA